MEDGLWNGLVSHRIAAGGGSAVTQPQFGIKLED
jgi:hypothetical protein